MIRIWTELQDYRTTPSYFFYIHPLLIYFHIIHLLPYRLSFYHCFLFLFFFFLFQLLRDPQRLKRNLDLQTTI